MNRIIDPTVMHPRDQIVAAISRIYKRGMTTTSGGNISMIDSNGDVWITPSAVDKGLLQPTDVVCVKSDGTIVGKHIPSSELPFHKAIYEIRPDIKVIIHAHPPALVSFSIVHQIPDTNCTVLAKNCCGAIGYAEYELPGSKKLGEKIAAEFRKGYKAIVMENHGTVLGGCDMVDAFQRFETLEFCSRTILIGKTIGEPMFLSDDQIEQFNAQIQEAMPEMTKVEHSFDELEKRSEIFGLVHRACDQGLMIGSYGTVSMRCNGNNFLITPHGIARWNLLPKDIVQIEDGKREPGKVPSRAAGLHQAIYMQNPGINSIIMTQPPYLMAYSITGQHVDVRTIPESWFLLQDIPSVPFHQDVMVTNRIPELLSEKTPAVLLQNLSVLVTGDRLMQTFDRLEVAEFSAQSLVMATSIGALVPMNDQQVDELGKVFMKR